MRLLRPVALPLLLLALAAPITAIDAWYKSGPLPAFVPENAHAIVTLDRMTALWRRVGETPAMAGACEDLQPDIAALALQVRRITGIRPTALRARIWLGSAITLASAPEGHGLCARPGLLLRARLWLGWHKSVGSGVRSYGDYFYGWRQGTLIAGTSAGYVRAAIAAPAAYASPAALPQTNDPSLLLTLRGQPPFTARFTLPHASTHVALDGVLGIGINQPKAPLQLPSALPPALAAVTAANPADLRALLQPALTAALRNAPPFLQRLVAAIPSDLAAAAQAAVDTLCSIGERIQTTETAVILFSVDTSPTAPVPTAAIAMRTRNIAQGPHPLSALLPPQEAMPFEWNGASGTLTPIIGEKLTLCLAARDKDWLAATTEPAMARLAAAGDASINAVDPINADAHITIDLPALSATAETLLIKAANMELIPGMNARDVQALHAPRFHAIARLGLLHLRLHANAKDETLFHGEFRPNSQAQSQQDKDKQ